MLKAGSLGPLKGLNADYVHMTSLYRAFNAVSGEIRRCGSERTVLQLVNSERRSMPCLLYALENSSSLISSAPYADAN